MKAEPLWWSQMPGPAKLVDSLVDTLLENGKVWLSGTFFWQNEFHTLVKEKLGAGNSSLDVEFLNLSELRAYQNVEELIFRFDERARANYLPAMNLADYVQTKSILKDKIIWLYGVDTDKGERWLELSKNLAKYSVGLRVVCEGSGINGGAKRITVVKQSDYISEFDTLLFAMTLIHSRDLNMETKIYVSRLANALSDRNPEKIAVLIDACDELLRDPAACAATIGICDETEADSAVKTAQLMSLYPKVEQARAQAISGITDRLIDLLPFKDNYETLFEKPEDLELRHIIFFEKQGNLRLTEEERRQFYFLYNMRNKLSHRQTIAGSDAGTLLNNTFPASR